MFLGKVLDPVQSKDYLQDWGIPWRNFCPWILKSAVKIHGIIFWQNEIALSFSVLLYTIIACWCYCNRIVNSINADEEENLIWYKLNNKIVY